MVKIWKLQEGQEVIALPQLPRSLIAYGPLPFFWGSRGQELLLRNEYLAAENRILKAQLRGV
jgi:hypothetical protein